MRVPGRLVVGRSVIPAFLAASLVASLALITGPGSVHAALGSAPAPAPEERPTPRELVPGETPGFRLPFETGDKVEIHQGWNASYSHHGRAAYAYDFGLPEGTPVLASASGVVAYTHDGETACGGPDLRKHANYVTIDHPDGSSTQYGHLASVEVEVGQVVKVGEVVGRAGKTGFTGCMPHLHFARQLQGGPVTQSLPVYFEGYPDKTFASGETVAAAEPACSASKKSVPLDAFCARYASEDGSPLFSRLESEVRFDWSTAGPGGYWLDDSTTGFAATFSGEFTFERAGDYSFDVVTTGPASVAIDGVTVVQDLGAATGLHAASGAITLTAGTHRIDLQQTNDGEGILRLSWVRLPDDPNRWTRSGPLLK